MAILVDLNGTIATPNGKPIKTTIDYLKSVDEDIYVISGSTDLKRKEYEKLLRRLNINYVQLILNPLDENTDLTFKLRMAQAIPNLSYAIDNNKKVISLYRDNGIKALSPDDLI